MSNSSKDLLNIQDATETKLQDPITNDESKQFINLVSNLVQTNSTMGFQKTRPETFNKGINMQTMNQHHNNANGSVVSMNVHVNQNQ
jgi:hypothetical protein